MESSRFFRYGFIGRLVLVLLVQAQRQPGIFLSLDCGLPENSSYTEPTSKINYISDAAYIQSGEIKSVSPIYKPMLPQQLWHVRSFPQGTKNCYNVTIFKGTKYLIRASFLYGNYDGKHNVPTFDIYIGNSLWDTVALSSEDDEMYKDIIHVPSTSKIHICLIKTDNGVPFISALEFRSIPNDTYKTVFGSLCLFDRFDMGSKANQSFRFPYDVYDRIWKPNMDSIKYTKISTSFHVDADGQNKLHPATIVMETAITPINASEPIEILWVSNGENTQYYVYMHFAEVSKLEPNQTRGFNITYNGNHWDGPIIPKYLSTTTIYKKTPLPVPMNEHQFLLVKIENSTKPPIINAVEIYYALEIQELETDQGERDAIRNIQSTYGLIKDWKGDPCVPSAYTWNGLSCNYDSITPRITSLDLSSSGLMGEISPFILNLPMLQTLDLSNNNLTGKVPNFLSRLLHLQVLNLENNKLEGPIPPELLQRLKNGSLTTIRMDGNPNLERCASNQCNKENNFIIPLVAPIGGLLFILIAAAIIYQICKTEKKPQSSNVIEVPLEIETNTQIHSSIEMKRPKFTYSEVTALTNNFERLLAKGSSGEVYYGVVDDNIQVAAKILPPSAIQSVDQFQVTILAKVHHRNLTSLIGYMSEETKLGLIYEYTGSGTLAQHLFDTSFEVLTWETRLQIAKDAVKGLDYLHHGCDPPIIHRDVKSTKILLTDDFQAKLSGFGLSRSFPIDGNSNTQVTLTTAVARTPGYLDPEYSTSNRLTEKSDIYSFGVVLLEIFTGRPVISRTNSRIHIIEWVNSMIHRGDITMVVDPKIIGTYETTSAWKAMELALACSSTNSRQRPSISEVVAGLEDCLAMALNERPESRAFPTDIIDMMPTTSEFSTESNPRAR